MKYIRTKSKIYEVESEFLDNKGKWVGYNIVEDDMVVILKIQVINQADTIEELCDEFVMVWNKKQFPYSTSRQYLSFAGYGDLKRDMREEENFGFYLNQDYIIYGAIWTDKGLIYVAKMNDKGELELI